MFKKQLGPLLKSPFGKRKPSIFFHRNLLLSVFVELIVIWILSGFFILQAPMEAVVTRWGNYERTVGPGIQWHIRGIEKVLRLEIDQPKCQVYTLSVLTSDASLVKVRVEIRYSIDNSRLFLFGIPNAKKYFSETVVSLLEQIISHSTLSDLLISKKTLAIQKELQKSLNTKLSSYPLGISLLSVSLPILNPPIELQEDFEAVSEIKKESQRIRSETQAKMSQRQNKTEFAVQYLHERANIRKQQMITNAKTETARFLALLPYYEKHPLLTAQYLQSEQSRKLFQHCSRNFFIESEVNQIFPRLISINKSLEKTKKGTTPSKEQL